MATLKISVETRSHPWSLCLVGEDVERKPQDLIADLTRGSFGPGTGQKDGRVAIVDDGPGLSPHELAKATTRFWRSRRHPSETGSGLGAIAERPVPARGGTLAVRANSPRGLIVECILPLAAEVPG
jgi:signal transduction histidine kinase